MKNRIHISLDDTKGIFKYLSGYKCKSIFETRTLKYLKSINAKYGTEFTLYCMCRSGDFHLKMVPDCYKEEFQENEEWLHWGFHAYDENSDYANSKATRIRDEYMETMMELSRITGITEFSDVIRLHKFSGNLEVCKTLRSLGIKGLLTADDTRESYYLSHDQTIKIDEMGVIWDAAEDLYFLKSLTRLEDCNDIKFEIEKAIKNNWTRIEIFTHEWQLDRDDVREKLRFCSEIIL